MIENCRLCIFLGITYYLSSPCNAKFDRRPFSPGPTPGLSLVDPGDRIKYVPSPVQVGKGVMGNLFPKTRNGTGLMGGWIEPTLYVDEIMDSAKNEMNKMGLGLIQPQDIEIDLSVLGFTGDVCKAGLYQSELRGITSFRRVGDVIVEKNPKWTKMKSTYEFSNISFTAGVEITCPKFDKVYDNGRIKIYTTNLTVNQVWVLDHETVDTKIEDFNINSGEVKTEVKNLGETGTFLEGFINKAVEQVVPLVQKIFNFNFKLAVNIGLQAAKPMLISSYG